MHTRGITRLVATIVIVIILVLAAVAGIFFAYYTPKASSTTTTQGTTSQASSTTSANTGPTNILVGYGGPPSCAGTTSLLLFVGEQIHAWDKYNINVTLVNFPAGDAASLSALSNGQIQVAETNTETFGLALSNGEPIKIFGQELIDGSWSLVVPANSSFTSISQLKNSKITIGTTAIGSTVWGE